MRRNLLQLAAAVMVILQILIVLPGCAPGKTVDITSLMDDADRLFLEGKYEEAILNYEQIIQIEPRNTEAYLGLANALASKGEIKKAVDVLLTGIDHGAEEEALSRLLEELRARLEEPLKQPTPSPLAVPVGLENNEEYVSGKIVSVSAGSGHTMALDDKGQLWVWGDNYYGQVGDSNISTYYDPIVYGDDESQEIANGRIRNVDNDVYSPKLIMCNVKAICARDNCSFAITNNDKLYAWGQNDCGQLGDGTTINKSKPTFIMDEILDVDSRYSTTCIIKKDNSLWIAGLKPGRQWDDTLGRCAVYEEPSLLYTNVKKAVYDGASDSNGGLLILTNNNRVISYMPREALSEEFIFFEWNELLDIIDINSIRQQVYALSGNGNVYGWGPSENLGIETDDFWINHPTLITANIKRILSGHMFIRNDDVLLIWGTVLETEDYRGSYGTDIGGAIIGELLIYDKKPSSILDRIVMASEGGSHFIVVDNEGNVYTWGDNFYGQLGDGSNIKQMAPKQIVFP